MKPYKTKEYMFASHNFDSFDRSFDRIFIIVRTR